MPSIDSGDQAATAEGLFDIVGAEGPILGQRAYQLYIRAAGGQRVGKEVRRVLNLAAMQLLRQGRVAHLKDDLVGVVVKTFYLPGQDPVAVRELGSRDLREVPRSEIQALLTRLGFSSGEEDDAKRAVLDALGLVRLTDRTSAYLDECFQYRYQI
jgi:hypothetical protein